MSILGFFAMGYVPSNLIVHGHAAATADNIAVSETLFRLGIAGELIGYAGFIFVALALYDLLKGVNRRHVSLMVILIVVSIPIAFLNELNSFAALALVRGADFLSRFEKPQREAPAMLFLNLHGYGFVVAENFGVCGSFRSRCLSTGAIPAAVPGRLARHRRLAWVILSLTGVLLPQYPDKVDTYSQPAFFGIAFMLWLLTRGARPPAPEAAASSAAG